MKDFYCGKKILITGGTGTLGQFLVKRLKEYGSKIVVYSRDEGKQALVFGDDKDITKVIGDVRDLEKIKKTMKLHKPDYVIHAGALKRIDDMEIHPDECIKTNINGSENVAIASEEARVKKCILISTDKACKPVNVYGSSKFVAERIYTNYDFNSSSTVFSSVRYGNVIGSRGSFIPMWIKLISSGKKIRVTSMECTRFLFTIEDAVTTVLKSLQLSEGGEVFIPKIKSYKMESIISAIKLLYNNNKEVDYDLIGMRPGEKFHEDMLCDTELIFSMEASPELICVLPQYTNRTHSYKKKYSGLEMNSSLHCNEDVLKLSEMIKRGMN
jgi:UDP-N-acetylglucosamine 4,6-dehydratase